MFDRYEAGEQAVLVHVNFNDENEREDLEELKLLVSSAGVNSVATITGSRVSPHPKYFVGSGKAEEIAEIVKMTEADVIIFNHALTPAQEKNLEMLCEARVLDRTTLILDIFAQRARTHEGKLQVELAQLKHMSSRLIRGWTHLERQKGGIGLRGPGETQLETDRRLLRVRIKQILSRLEKVGKQRDQGRRARMRAEIPTLALVGYTNAGKSTLFNQITDAKVYAADQLFATLDPTLRRIEVDDVGGVVLADTVGFIRHLPHDLVAAFKATLTETREADLLLHVIDCSDERMSENVEQVDVVLEEIEAGDTPRLLVFNKVDALEDGQAKLERNQDGLITKVWLSAMTGEGLKLLFQAISERLSGTMLQHQLRLSPSEGKLRSRLYQLDCVMDEQVDETGDCFIQVRIPIIEWQRLIKKFDGLEQQVIDSEQVLTTTSGEADGLE